MRSSRLLIAHPVMGDSACQGCVLTHLQLAMASHRHFSRQGQGATIGPLCMTILPLQACEAQYTGVRWEPVRLPKDDTSDLGKSLATWMTRGPRGLQDFMCSTMSSFPVWGPVYVRSTCTTHGRQSAINNTEMPTGNLHGNTDNGGCYSAAASTHLIGNS